MMGNKKIIIVGGGITGLATAYILSKSCADITILEGSDKLGGLLGTFAVGDNTLEYYYHHFFTHDEEINWLINDLGIQDRLIFRKTKMGVFRDKHIYDFSEPGDLLHFAPLSIFGKIRFALTSVFLGKLARWDRYESVPALDWLYRWAGKNVTDTLWKPLLAVKFGPYADQIPLAWMIGRLRQRINSRKKNEEYLGYLNGSLKVLLDALVEKLKAANVKIVTDARIEKLIIEGAKIVGVKTKDAVFMGDQVVLTIPSMPAEQLIAPYHSALARKIGQVKYFGAVCVILELEKRLSDVYWLNIADDGYPFGGIIEHTNFIPEQYYGGRHLVYLSRYFALEEDIASMDENQIKELMIPPLKNIFKNYREEWIQKAHVFKTRTAAPICDLNFSKKVVDAKLPIENLYLVNMMHIYPDERSVNNSIRLAAEVGRVMGYPTAFVPRGKSMSGQIGFDK